MQLMKDWIVQITFILIPILLSFSLLPKKGSVLFNGSPDLKNQLGMGLICSFSVMVCMTYSVPMVPGFSYDLRIVPLIFSVFYGGGYAGLLAAACLVLYRLLAGWSGVGMALASNIPIVLLSVVLARRYRGYTARMKFRTVCLLSLMASFLQIGLPVLQDPSSMTRSLSFQLLLFPVIQLAAAMLSLLVMETFMEKKAAETQIELTEKVKLAGQISASMAHEVRNPLTVIKGFLKMLERPLPEEKRAEYLKICLGEVERAESVINDYLGLTKITSHDEEIFDTGKQLEHCISIIQSFSLMNGVEIAVQIPEEPILTKGNKEKFNQVIVNMTKNAVEACKDTEDGRVSIRLSRNDQVSIRIQDNGPGIEPKQLELIGRSAFTTKSLGTGLGLIVCYQIIRSMRGRIEATSKVGKGTVFEIILPAVHMERLSLSG